MKKQLKNKSLFSFNTFGSILTAGLLLLGAASCGTEGGNQEEQVEEGLGYEELNENQQLSNREAEGNFEQWDKDENQRIDRQEFETAANEAGLYSEWDNDGNELLTVSELSEGVFNIYDEDKDNMLDKEEFTSWNEAWGGEYAERWEAWDTNDDNMLSVEEFTTGFDDAGVFNTWDTNDDNVYTKEEVYTALFEALDEGGDGYLREEEFRQVNNYIRAI